MQNSYIEAYICMLKAPQELVDALKRISSLSVTGKRKRFLHEVHADAMIMLIERRQELIRVGRKIDYLVSPSQGKPINIMLKDRALLSRIERIAKCDDVKPTRFFYTALCEYARSKAGVNIASPLIA